MTDISLEKISNFFLNEKFWLPNNFTWAEINKYNNLSYKNIVVYPIIIAITLYLIRIIVER